MTEEMYFDAGKGEWLPVLDENAPPRNVPLLRKVLEKVEGEPENWDQENWITPCGTKACFAGHALAMTGHDLSVTVPNEMWHRAVFRLDGQDLCMTDFTPVITRVAAEELGLTEFEAEELFHSGNSMERLRLLAEHYAGERL